MGRGPEHHVSSDAKWSEWRHHEGQDGLSTRCASPRFHRWTKRTGPDFNREAPSSLGVCSAVRCRTQQQQ